MYQLMAQHGGGDVAAVAREHQSEQGDGCKLTPRQYWVDYDFGMNRHLTGRVEQSFKGHFTTKVTLFYELSVSVGKEKSITCMLPQNYWLYMMIEKGALIYPTSTNY